MPSFPLALRRFSSRRRSHRAGANHSKRLEDVLLAVDDFSYHLRWCRLRHRLRDIVSIHGLRQRRDRNGIGGGDHGRLS